MNFASCAGFVRVQIVNWEAENELCSKDHTTAPLRENKSRMSYQCLLFDLDGTLVDSRADLINSVNLMLAELGRRTLPDNRVLTFVGNGVRMLVERALKAGQNDPLQGQDIDRALEIFKRLYREHLLDQTRVYPGVKQTLARLCHIPKAVVTNKPYEFTIPLLEGIGLSSYFEV